MIDEGQCDDDRDERPREQERGRRAEAQERREEREPGDALHKGVAHGDMRVRHDLHRPRSSTQLATGMLSYHRMAIPQPGQ